MASVRIAAARFTHGARSAIVRLDRRSSGILRSSLPAGGSSTGRCLRRPIRAGAVHIPQRVTRITRTPNGWSVDTRDGRSTRTGSSAPTARTASCAAAWRGRSRATDLSIAAGYFVHGRTVARDRRRRSRTIPPGYLWSFPRPDHLAVGICAQADVTSSSVLLEQARRGSTGTPPDGTLERYSWPIPSLGEAALATERPARHGWMLVGDAAGLVDPITREGISFALRSADIAADALLAGDSPAATYVRRLRRDIYDELARAARFKARFFQPRFMGLLLQGLDRSARDPRRDGGPRRRPSDICGASAAVAQDAGMAADGGVIWPPRRTALAARSFSGRPSPLKPEATKGRISLVIES